MHPVVQLVYVRIYVPRSSLTDRVVKKEYELCEIAMQDLYNKIHFLVPETQFPFSFCYFYGSAFLSS